MNFSAAQKEKNLQLPITLLFIETVFILATVLDIPVVRQVAGFFYLTFVPGFIFVWLLKLNGIDRLEIILFSIGFSIAFLMIAGFLTDVLYLVLKIPAPLSLIPLMVFVNVVIIIGTILAYSRGEGLRIFGGWEEFSGKALLILILPVLGIIGAMWLNITGSSLILTATVVLVAASFVILTASKKMFPVEVYASAIFAIALFLLFSTSFISDNVVVFGSDIANEFFVAKLTQSQAFWNPALMFPGTIAGELYGRFYSMLSITILPTVYSTLLNMNLTWVFKILYPLIFSFVPLGLYQLWQRNFGKKEAFIAAFLFMAQATFYTEMLALAREMIAELFFVLLLIVIFEKKLKPFNKAMCFVVFSFALITAHYSLAIIFLFFIVVASIYLIVSKHQSRSLTIFLVVFFFVAMFSWYIYSNGAATFNAIISFGNNVYTQLSNFFTPSSRGQTVLEGLGLVAPATIWNTISRAFAYVTEALIALGFVGLITKRVSVQFEREYSIFTLTAVAFLIALIVVPGLANTLNMTRFYHILLFFLAPICVLGAEFLMHAFTKVISKNRAIISASVLLLIILVPYFLFQTGFVYEFTGTQSWSLPLSKNKMTPVFLRVEMGYFDEREFAGALWMSKNMKTSGSEIYEDAVSGGVLVQYVSPYNLEGLSNTTVLSENSLVYLNQVNIAENLVLGSSNSWNTTSIFHILGPVDEVYSNGGCQVYKSI
jgi:uncharacterized membrane protein